MLSSIWIWEDSFDVKCTVLLFPFKSNQIIIISILVLNSDTIDTTILVKKDIDLDSEKLNSHLSSATDFFVTLERGLNISSYIVSLNDLQNPIIF